MRTRESDVCTRYAVCNIITTVREEQLFCHKSPVQIEVANFIFMDYYYTNYVHVCIFFTYDWHRNSAKGSYQRIRVSISNYNPGKCKSACNHHACLYVLAFRDSYYNWNAYNHILYNDIQGAMLIHHVTYAQSAFWCKE